MFEQEAVETLCGLGLTLNEARVYFALIQCGVSSAKTVSKFSGVIRQDVYRVMPKLQQKGLVNRALTIPAVFDAIPLEDGVSILMEKRRKRTEELQQKTAVLVDNQKNNHRKFSGGELEPEFVVIPGDEASIKRKKMAIDAERYVDNVISRKRFVSGLSYYGELTLKRLERGVRYRLITEMPGDGEILPKIFQDLREHPLFRLRYVTASPRAFMCVIDNREVLFSDPAASPLEYTCLWSKNPSLLAVLHDYFELMWITAMETPHYSVDDEQTAQL